MPEVKTLAS